MISKKFIRKLGIVALLLISVVTPLSPTQSDFQAEDINNNEIKKKQIRKANYWDLTGNPIFIDDSDPTKNWTYTAANYDWCDGSGIWADPDVIENVSIDGEEGEFCIKIQDSNAYFIIRNCTIYNSGPDYQDLDAGIKIVNTNNGALKNNHIFNNKFYGLYLSYIENLTVDDNLVEKNNLGIYMRNSQHNEIINNNIEKNNAAGFNLYNSDNNEIINNIIKNNKDYGISLSSNSDKILIEKNEISENDATGIKIDDSSENEIIDNIINNNDGHGIYLGNSNDNEMRMNTICENEGNGIDFQDSDKNEVIENEISRNGVYGITLSSNSDNNYIYKNTLEDNGLGCIADDGSNNIIKENTCSGNFFYYFLIWLLSDFVRFITFILIITVSIVGVIIIVKKWKKKKLD